MSSELKDHYLDDFLVIATDENGYEWYVITELWPEWEHDKCFEFEAKYGDEWPEKFEEYQESRKPFVLEAAKKLSLLDYLPVVE